MDNRKKSKQNSVFIRKFEKVKNMFYGGFGEIGVEPIVNHISSDNKSCSILKWNRYNYIKKNSDNEHLLFNCLTNNHMCMVEEIKKIIEDNINSVNKIESIHPELFNFMKSKEFIIDESFDETEDAIKRIKIELNSPNYYELFINPTLDCNLRCWYCYQSHQKKTFINEYTLSSIINFIRNLAESSKLKEITISFFGGEPLLRFDQTIWPIIEFAQKICMENKKELYIYFNTNGVLLTRKIVDQLYTADLYCNFQVTFDGNEEDHNKTKFYANGKDTFAKTINNVMYALSKGLKFTIRCNYTSENLHSFNELISIFTEYAAECINYGLLTFSYHKVWQVENTTEMETVVDKYESRTSLLKGALFQKCYADKENSIVINYNGDVFNCAARDFKPEDREGYLNRDGKIIYNKKHKERMEVRFSNKNCLNCKIFPICIICTQVRLERQNRGARCLMFYTEDDKERLLLKRIEMMSKQ
jgi:uncharacterized protein